MSIDFKEFPTISYPFSYRADSGIAHHRCALDGGIES